MQNSLCVKAYHPKLTVKKILKKYRKTWPSHHSPLYLWGSTPSNGRAGSRIADICSVPNPNPHTYFSW